MTNAQHHPRFVAAVDGPANALITLPLFNNGDTGQLVGVLQVGRWGKNIETCRGAGGLALQVVGDTMTRYVCLHGSRYQQTVPAVPICLLQRCRATTHTRVGFHICCYFKMTTEAVSTWVMEAPDHKRITPTYMHATSLFFTRELAIQATPNKPRSSHFASSDHYQRCYVLYQLPMERK